MKKKPWEKTQRRKDPAKAIKRWERKREQISYAVKRKEREA